MTAEVILKYLHFVFIFAVVSSVVVEHLLLKPQMTRQEIKRLSTIDAVYGIGSVFIVAAGMILWLSDIGKPAAFYTQNHIFLTKVGLFVIVGLLSIYPTVFFLKNRKGEDSEELVTIPKVIKVLIRIELLILFLIPLLATMMAKGIGYSG